MLIDLLNQIIFFQNILKRMVILYFRVEDQGVTNNVSYDDNTTAENFILDYLGKNTNYVTLDKKIYTFMANAKCWNTEKFLKQPLKNLIRSNGIVKLTRKQNIHYSLYDSIKN